MGGRQNTSTKVETKGGAIFENYFTAPLIQMISVFDVILTVHRR